MRAPQPLAELERVAERDAERRQILGQGGRRPRVVGLQLAHQPAQPSLAVGRRAGLVERRPVGIADSVVEVLALGQLAEQVPQSEGCW